MNSRSKDLALIVVALIAILGCGYGLGKRFSPRTVEIDPPSVALENFEEVTLSNLAASLDLTPEQEAALVADIQSTSAEIAETRRQALFEYHLQILKLHDKISGKLTPEQQEKLANSRKTLQEVLEKRFPELLDGSRAKSGGGSQEPEHRP